MTVAINIASRCHAAGLTPSGTGTNQNITAMPRIIRSFTNLLLFADIPTPLKIKTKSAAFTGRPVLRVEELFYFFITLIFAVRQCRQRVFRRAIAIFHGGIQPDKHNGYSISKKKTRKQKEQGAFLVPSKSSEVINGKNNIIKVKYTTVILITK
ncbi:hypothetical protein ACS25B_16200 [Dickeya dadantii subsp. dieffenbachiae]|uniref:hypothetical protein n=1 Tax=Dickeya dadantii TaxID=204038 RepID=UPI001F3D6D11|nr:hypothetical protein [Dickeya dadantii]